MNMKWELKIHNGYDNNYLHNAKIYDINMLNAVINTLLQSELR